MNRRTFIQLFSVIPIAYTFNITERPAQQFEDAGLAFPLYFKEEDPTGNLTNAKTHTFKSNSLLEKLWRGWLQIIK